MYTTIATFPTTTPGSSIHYDISSKSMQCTYPSSSSRKPTLIPSRDVACQKYRQEDYLRSMDDAEGSDTSIEPEEEELSDWDSLEIDDMEYTDEDLKDFGRPGRRRHVGDQDSTMFGNMQEVRHTCSQRRRCVDEDGRSADGREKVSQEDRQQPENAVEALKLRLQRVGNGAMCRSRSRSMCSTRGCRRR